MKRIFVIKRNNNAKDIELAQFSYDEENKTQAVMNLFAAVAFMDGYVQALTDQTNQYWEQSMRRDADGYQYCEHRNTENTISVMIDYNGNGTGKVAKFSDFN